MSSHEKELHPDEKTRLGDLGPRITRFGLILGVIGMAAAVGIGFSFADGMRSFFSAYLVGYCFFLSISLGALWFVMIQHLVSAKWSIVVRRVAEILTQTFPLMAVLLAVGIVGPMLAGNDSLYFWTQEAAKDDHLIHAKLGYLNTPFFLIRCVVYFAVWTGLSRYFYNKSVAQDETGDVDTVRVLRKWSAPGVIAFAFTTCLAAFDLLMSLAPAWYSTMFGVYFFAGCAISIFAVLSLSHHWLQARGRLVHSVTVEHYHDCGKLMFAFVFFWGYVAFSQFMLIWYADIPEETIWFNDRILTNWSWMSLAILLLGFIFPFVSLMSRWSKRIPKLLIFFSCWCLLWHYIDLFWIVMPVLSPGSVVGGMVFLMSLAALLGIGGFYVAVVAQVAGKTHLIPVKEPGLSESLSFENY